MFIAFAVPLRLLGAVVFALLLHKRFRGVAGYRTAGYLPTVVPDVAFALLWLWIFNPLYGPLNLALGALGGPTPSWLTDPRAAQWAVIIMSLFTIGEGFIVAMATRQGIPPELYELGDIEGARPHFMFLRITLPVMAPTLLLLMFRDTIYSFQANFVPALIVTEGGPHPYATTVPAALHLPERVRVSALRLRRRSDAHDVPGHGVDHLSPVPHHQALAACVRRLALRAPTEVQPASRWRGPESNRRHHGFQPCALPTELPRRGGQV